MIVIVLEPSGLVTGQQIAQALGGELHGLAGRVAAGRTFSQTADHLRELFAAGETIVGVCAAGILLRCLAPVLADKRQEPPVIAVAEDGSSVVPLLGGHHGGNALARRIAAIVGGHAAVTTAGDLAFGLALDDPPAGWTLANPHDAKAFVAALLEGSKVRLEGECSWLEESDLPLSADGDLVIRVSERIMAGNARTLIYHPACLAVGVGCERGAEAAELTALVEGTLATAGLAPAAVAGVYSLDLKADEEAVHAVAAKYEISPQFFTAARLEQETPRLAKPSEVVFAEVGCHGVAEGAALAAAGADAELVVSKQKSNRATCAVARAAEVIEMTGPRGSLAVVGIGPGSQAWRTPEASRLLRQASDLVGYSLYLDLVGPAAQQVRHDYPLGEEESRVRAALDLAAEGRRVALVSSGDAGIYAMATLVFELIDNGDRPDWRGLEVNVSPGVSAMQAAAARAGAPLGHDFCAISLSDLLTPWEAIEKRIKAATEGDFVVAFYNPVSRRRTTQLARAQEILAAKRPIDTPVMIGRNLGREDEALTITTLEALDPASVDMLSIVIVGSSETRTFDGPSGPRVYTPRGYAGKERS
ncbi:MAG: precorrin-3B C(17)-methyltransferase [Alphaproteobacteria bacterium]|jgi:cobalt-precorrin 5A hydrolase/precorrin-3B C17-methyltransferase|nr:precorrin-3B C(17)-methyltransferase [Rhodospirillaceae bacterium]MDP6407345.1 precorrin-3B C(17)-methyltransferase [Alphaproteobacteria bacterium]MDP6624784.1 precorrin-3B C(17)-methyltransferase [Alphaproteobacteria bacterium]